MDFLKGAGHQEVQQLVVLYDFVSFVFVEGGGILKEINGIPMEIHGILKEINGIPREINGILMEIIGILKEI